MLYEVITNYLLAKWVRCAMGTNNVDNCARVCHAPTVAGLATSLGAGAATNSLEQMPEIDTLFLIGSNPTEAHPIVSIYLKEALARGAKLVVADPRRTCVITSYSIHYTKLYETIIFISFFIVVRLFHDER